MRIYWLPHSMPPVYCGAFPLLSLVLPSSAFKGSRVTVNKCVTAAGELTATLLPSDKLKCQFGLSRED